jgi:uncharacterized protein (TIGR02266 family)
VSALPLVRVRLKYPDVETLVERFSPNVTRGGIFLASRDPRPVGALLRFEVSLLSGTPVLAGEGKVTWVKPFDPAAPSRPHGMGVSFTRIDPSCTEMFRRLVEQREISPSPRRAAGLSSAALDGTPVRMPEAFSAELEGIDDGALRRTIDRARVLAARVENLDDLLVKEVDEAPTLEQALADLPRYLQGRRAPAGNPRAGVVEGPARANESGPAPNGRDPESRDPQSRDPES